MRGGQTKNYGLDYRWPIENDDYDGQLDHWIIWSIRKRSKAKKTYPKICQGQISRMLRRHLCVVVTFARENSDCFLTTTVAGFAQTGVCHTVEHRPSALGSQQQPRKASWTAAFFSKNFKNSTLQSIFHLLQAPKVFSAPGHYLESYQRKWLFLLCTIHSISAIFGGGGLKNTPLPTKVLRPKKATKECFIMQNVSGGGEENGHGWLKKNEVLRGGSAIQKLLERLYPSGNWWMNVPMDYYC